MSCHHLESDEFMEWMAQTGRTVFDEELAEAFAAGQSSQTEIVAWLVGEQILTGGVGLVLVWDRGAKPASIGFDAIPLRGISSRLEKTRDLA